MKITDDYPPKSDDGLLVEDVHAWAEEKYRLVQHYSSLFCKSMRRKWESLVYIDLFSGPGRSRIDHKRIIDAVPLLVTNTDCLYDKYIFCDVSVEKCDALKQRIERQAITTNFEILNGDANVVSQDILRLIPPHNRQHRVLGFCFIDPYKIANLQFETIRTLSNRFIDFLVLIPTGMDANRNESQYTKPKNKKLDVFLGASDWRREWRIAKAQGESFEPFVAKQFSKNMQRLGYLDPGFENMKPVMSVEKNLLLYRLALYSKHPLGTKFWKDTVEYTQLQRRLDI